MATAAPTKKPASNGHAAPRLHELYRKELGPALGKRFNHKNILATARLEKIIVNIGCGEAAHDAKHLESVQKDLGLITGQRPLITRAKKAISNFKIREQDPVGCKVTLRRARMYEFLDRLVSTALPRIRDFRGLSLNGFDQAGNYSFGIKEHTIFPEIMTEHSQYPTGMDVTMVMRSPSREEAMELLKGFGMPFVKPDSKDH